MSECPICKREYSEAPAISRKGDHVEICPICGTKEALEAIPEGYFGGNVKLSENPTIEEITNHNIAMFKERWRCGYDYSTVQVKQYPGEEVDLDKATNAKLIATTLYCNQAACAPLGRQKVKLPEQLRKEAMHWDAEGGFCIYTSVLAYCLFYEFGVFEKEQMRLIQGFYKHQLREDFSNLIPFGKLQVGLHSFLLVDKSVFDFSLIIQEEYFFDFKDTGLFIMGKVPEGMELWGFEEEHQIIKEYAREIAKESGQTYAEWIAYHKHHAASVAVAIFDKYR